MGDVFFSFRGRVVINVEALNMVESVGNYTKHRRVPVIAPQQYVTYMVPAISGEALAHGYQTVLAEKALQNNLPVCGLCSRGIFLKSTNADVFKKAFNQEPPGTEHEFEKTIVSKCVVEDVGGFLYAAAEAGIKRTSNFYVGYMIPVGEALTNTVIEPQLHTRYALGTEFVKRGDREARGQMIYYVELSSAPYTFSFDLDTRNIGKATYQVEHVGEPLVNENEIVRRKIVSLEAFKEFILENHFGAKKSRFLPVIEWENFVAAVSDSVWTVPSPFTSQYIENAEKKKRIIDRNTKLYIYRREGPESFEEVLSKAIEDAENRVKG